MKTTITDQYVLVETDDIDFSILREVVESVTIEHENSNTVALLQQEQSKS